MQAWLLAQEGSPNAISDSSIVEHIATCASCQHTLLILMARLLDVPLEIETISCEQCQEDIAAYIDVEQSYGPRAAANRFPAVWWHLWTCPECVEVYQDTLDFLQADKGEMRNALALKEPVLIELSVNLMPPQPQALVWSSDLERAKIKNRVAAALYLQGTFGDSEDWPILSQTAGPYLVQMTVRQQGSGWIGLVQVQPALSGQVALTIGDEILSADLDSDGHATIPALPLDRLVKEEQEQRVTLVIKALPE
ncbi:MAG TPA: hypothetical protein VFS21_20065 [Roseiflexaceae bacterium]|nr:hypothetical protein [Roseiflexaceae bacterium]